MPPFNQIPFAFKVQKGFYQCHSPVSSPATATMETSLTFQCSSPTFSWCILSCTFYRLSSVCHPTPRPFSSPHNPTPYSISSRVNNILVCPGLRRFLGHGTFSAKARGVPGKLRQVGHPEFILTHCSCHSG